MTAPEMTAHDFVTMGDVKTLAAASGPCITILVHIPTPFELSQRLKNAIRIVQRKLGDIGSDLKSADSLMEPIHKLVVAAEIAGIWSNSLVLLRSPDVFRYFLLRLQQPEMEDVGERFQIRPVLSVLATEQRFYVLGLSRRRIQLLYCTQHRAEEVHIRSVQTDFQVWLNTRQPDHDLDNRAAAGPSVGSMQGVTFGTSTDRERENESLSHFFKQVDKEVNTVLRAQDAPLMLAGVESEVAIYRQVSTYPRFHQEVVSGSPDGLSDQELHRRALELALQSHSELLDEALSAFEKERDSGRVLTDPREIVKAAWEGRVADLFLAEKAALTGSWNEEKYEIEEDNRREDLLNAAALQTLLHDGRAFVLGVKDMPSSHEVVAVRRF